MTEETNMVFTDNYWPTSEFKRPAPGLAVEGRIWRNITYDALVTLIGDIIRDSSSFTVVLSLTCTKNTNGNPVIEAGLKSTESQAMDFDALPRAELDQFIAFYVDRSQFQGTSGVSMDVCFHGSGFFWLMDQPKNA